MQLFFGRKEGGALLLDEMEIGHLRVLRKEIGDVIHVMDGRGKLYSAIIHKISKKTVELGITTEEIKDRNRDYYLHIGIAPTKSMDRLEWFVEKVIEMGVDAISFLKVARSERKVVKEERIRKIALSACKQSMEFYLPELHFNQTIENLASKEFDFMGIAHCMESKKIKLPSNSSKNIVLIGPEGDFTKEEVDLALANGFKAIDLGVSRLRTETAGVFVAASYRCNNLG